MSYLLIFELKMRKFQKPLGILKLIYSTRRRPINKRDCDR